MGALGCILGKQANNVPRAVELVEVRRVHFRRADSSSAKAVERSSQDGHVRNASGSLECPPSGSSLRSSSDDL